MNESVFTGRMKLSIFRYDECNCCEKKCHKQINYSNDYMPSVVTQLITLPIKQQQSHGDINMNCLGISALKKQLNNVRYIEIQFTFAVLGYVSNLPQA